MKEYEIALGNAEGAMHAFQIVGKFRAENDERANERMKTCWYLLRDGKYVKGGEWVPPDER